MAKREENVRYINMGAPTGWAAMAKTIQDVDEDKVGDYKEDIDTLLVFTGLFSAVLTAFIIESYKALSPDKTDTIIALLGQISSQTNSYRVNTELINSTVLPLANGSGESAFEPSVPAVRVNVLWFASLILTLMTASFGILVKQWLREYLAFDYTSPHERVRARQFRHPGLADWKVFEIAGFLPLLLQVALGLFFLGLCFFTRSVHPSIGNTSTPLVAVWAFCFMAATIAPVCSPRCPYKTALLKGIMRRLRRFIRRFLFPFSAHSGLRPILLSAAPGMLPAPHAGSFYWKFRFIGRRHFVEEHEAVKHDTDEVAILEEVDAILLDDELLGSTIFDSLTQNNADPSTVIKFVLRALNARLVDNIPVQPLITILDLQRLTKRGWIAVSDIVASTVQQALAKRAAQYLAGSWLKDAIFILLSYSDQPLTRNAGSALVRCIHKGAFERFEEVIDSFSFSYQDSQWIHVRTRLCRICELLSVPEVTPQEAINFVLKLFSLDLAGTLVPQIPLTKILNLGEVSREVWTTSCDTIGAIVLQGLSNSGATGGNSAATWLTDALYLLLSFSSYPMTDRAWDALVRCLQKDTISRLGEVLRTVMSQPEHKIHATERVIKLCQLLSARDVPAAETISFALHAFGDGRSSWNGHNREPSVVPLLDLREVTEEMWVVVSDTVAAAVLNALRKRTNDIGHWLEDALLILLSLSTRPMTPKARELLDHCIQKDTVLRSRLARLLHSLESPDSEHFPHVMARFCECLAISVQTAQPTDMITFIQQSPEPPSQGAFFRSVWIDISDTLAATVIRAFDAQATGQDALGPWLEDALRVLLSLSDQPITPPAGAALNHCLQKNAVGRSRTVQFVRSLASPEGTQMSLFISRLSSICECLFNYHTATSDVMYLLLGALGTEASELDSDQASATLLDLRQLSQPAWFALSDAVSSITSSALQPQDQGQANSWTGPWLGDATRLLLGLCDHPMTEKACDTLVLCAQDERMSPLVRTLASPEHEHFAHTMHRLHGLCEYLLSRTAPSSDAISSLLVMPVSTLSTPSPSAAPITPLPSIMDLRTLEKNVWDVVADNVAKTTLKGIEKHNEGQDLGQWLEDAIHILLSLTDHPLSSKATEALAGCVRDIHKRLSKCIRPLSSPESPYFGHIISRLRDVCRCLSTEKDVEWLVKKVGSSAPCTPQCDHGESKPSQLYVVVHYHASQYEEWARYYLPFLLDRVELILGSPPGSRWPAGSMTCFNSLLSFPIPLDTVHPESAKTVLKIFCSKEHAMHALTALVSLDPKDRSHLRIDAAVETIASVAKGANTEGRRKFFGSMRAACGEYVIDAAKEPKERTPNTSKMNIVRLCALVCKTHWEVRSDTELPDAWRAFYPECANAMKRFQESKQKLFKQKEHSSTAELAEKSLTLLDRLEPPVGDLGNGFDDWEETFDPSASVFPDELFQLLASYIPNDVAMRYKRVVTRLVQSLPNITASVVLKFCRGRRHATEGIVEVMNEKEGVFGHSYQRTSESARTPHLQYTATYYRAIDDQIILHRTLLYVDCRNAPCRLGCIDTSRHTEIAVMITYYQSAPERTTVTLYLAGRQVRGCQQHQPRQE
ncbi:hypothetical protein NM688_g3888 [Phlebia brevispora]|uniref:Uncharacterized protein n=1 Tax=Phlebia brevispora TaxID=194682 RepID=A0ACC1T468_9APHY|nr:hypothetical protein NM688_g3888 [Phlebia brevispora]